MKLLIASDIHGSAYYCRKLITAFEAEGADRMLILGDILYHGPRNDLPREYVPKEVVKLLNPLKNKIFCVRGNCDSEVDQFVLEFPIMADYAIIPTENGIIYATHGHQYNENSLPPIQKGDILLHGHTHVPVVREHEDYTYINPGSLSIPKENTPHSYMTFDGKTFLWKNIESGEVYNTFSL